MITIRAAKASDLEPVQRCARAAFEVYIERMGKTPAPMVADFQSHIAAGQMIVVENNERLAGYAVCYAKGRDFQLDNIAINPEFQSTGLGRKLIDYIDDLAKRQGAEAVTLYTNEKMTENLDWYISLGYTETDRRREDGFSRVYFRKPI